MEFSPSAHFLFRKNNININGSDFQSKEELFKAVSASPFLQSCKDPAASPTQKQEREEQAPKKPYVFLSHSHKDVQLARDLASWMKDQGIRVLLEDGFNAGNDWADQLSLRIAECAHFMPLITKNYVASVMCQKELTLATVKRKRILPLFAEDFDLPTDFELMLTIYQGVHRTHFKGDEDFFKAVTTLPMLRDCQEKTAPAPAKESTEASTEASKKEELKEEEKNTTEQVPPKKEQEVQPSNIHKEPPVSYTPKTEEDFTTDGCLLEKEEHRAERKEIRMLLLYAKELLEKGEQDHARQRLYSAVISSEELFKKNGQREELQALEEAHKLLSESFFSSDTSA